MRDSATDLKIVVIIAITLIVLTSMILGGCSSPAADVDRYPFRGPWVTPDGQVVEPPSYEVKSAGAEARRHDIQLTAATWATAAPDVQATLGLCGYRDVARACLGVYAQATVARFGPVRLTTGAVTPFEDAEQSRPTMGLAVSGHDFWKLPAWLAAEVGVYVPCTGRIDVPDSVQWQLGLVRGAW